MRYTNKTINFIKYSKLCYILSIIFLIFAVFVFYKKGVNLGIDFRGGIVLELSDKNSDTSSLRECLDKASYENSIIQDLGDNNFLIKLRPNSKNTDEIGLVMQKMKDKCSSTISYNKSEFIGPKVTSELISNGLKAVLVCILAILTYICYRFSFSFAISTVVALFHDVVSTVAFYVVMQYEFDLNTVAALLTVLGYSVNDTVVIFDRVRENMSKDKNPQNIKSLVNKSLTETLSRTIMTAATTLVVCVCLMMFGGKTLLSFSSAISWGIFVGTYSSLFIAAPLLSDILTSRYKKKGNL